VVWIPYCIADPTTLFAVIKVIPVPAVYPVIAVGGPVVSSQKNEMMRSPSTAVVKLPVVAGLVFPVACLLDPSAAEAVATFIHSVMTT
jgi:hypothetical protein